jgi:hypothetical protein
MPIEKRYKGKNMAQDIRIVTWNANGLLQHRNELQMFLDIKKIDICLVSETHFTNESYIRLKGYCVYHTIHPSNAARGGSAVIIRDSVQHFEEISISTEKMQVTVVTIKCKTQTLKVAAIYCPPRYNLKKEDYMFLLHNLGKTFILGGDFNAKHTYWGSRLITTKGRELYSAAKELNCDFHSTGKPTYWPTDVNKIPDLLDFFITRNISQNYVKVEEELELAADHSSVVMTLSDKVIIKEDSPTLVNKTTNWLGFQEDLSSKIQLSVRLRTIKELDEEAEAFVKNIQQAAWANTRIIKRRTAGNNYPMEIREMVSEKRRIRKRWQQYRVPRDKTRLNQITQQLKREIQKIKSESINSYLRELSYEKDTEYSLWKAMKRIKRPKMQNPPLRQADGTWARSNQEKANLFANHLENTFQPYDIYSDENLPMNGENTSIEIYPVTPKEVALEIKTNINIKKAPGYDLITGEILKNLPRKGIVKLTNLINASFRLKYVPMCWKVAEVIMIPKPGKQVNVVTSYRPISLLPMISKLYEKLLLKRLKPIIEEKRIIPLHQFGFRDKHATIDQVHRITNLIEKALEEKNVCSAVFLDVAQAFDKVWHRGLVHKLEQLLPKQYSSLLKSYITGRLFRVKSEDQYSELRPIKAGVPQGSVLGPLLYLLYTCDVPETEETMIATFADDTGVLAVGCNEQEANNNLQVALNKISAWTNLWRIKLNETKSVHINFTNRRAEQIPIIVNNHMIPYANTAKYLGMNLDAKLRWKEHIKKKCTELNLKYKKMYWLLGRTSELTVHNKIMLYKQVLKPVWAYGIQLWGCASKSNIEVIQRFQNKVLRNIVNAPWYVRNSDLHRDLGVEMVAEEIKKFGQKHEVRLHSHVNIEAIQLLDQCGIARRLKRTKPFELV